jgi:hypothetical protein
VQRGLEPSRTKPSDEASDGPWCLFDDWFVWSLVSIKIYLIKQYTVSNVRAVDWFVSEDLSPPRHALPPHRPKSSKFEIPFQRPESHFNMELSKEHYYGSKQ